MCRRISDNFKLYLQTRENIATSLSSWKTMVCLFSFTSVKCPPISVPSADPWRAVNSSLQLPCERQNYRTHGYTDLNVLQTFESHGATVLFSSIQTMSKDIPDRRRQASAPSILIRTTAVRRQGPMVRDSKNYSIQTTVCKTGYCLRHSMVVL